MKIPTENGETEEKIHQIRLYSGEKYILADEVRAGTVCAVTGLTAAHTGDALGAEKGKSAALLEPVFTYRVHAEKADAHTVLEKLRILEEEDPLLHVVYDDAAREIRVQLMGEVQLEILKRLCRSRFGLDLTFGEGGILYRETIAAPVEGATMNIVWNRITPRNTFLMLAFSTLAPPTSSAAMENIPIWVWAV